ncbi:MAG: hypothetical protein MK033_06810 [Candidatus Caenarcaniphilales bacterium]|nr:hypothetical protein [Candidatus Caenarcaniphilales bacterium]
MNVRNVFDQYSQYENKLTHAFICSLDRDQDFLRIFIKDFLQIKINKKDKLSIYLQSLPHKVSRIKDPSGLPDASILINDNQVICIENKVEDILTRDQLERHKTTWAKNENIDIEKSFSGVTFAPKEYDFQLEDWKHYQWSELYLFLRKHINREWVKELFQYMEVLEMNMIKDKKLGDLSLTCFSGIPFNKENPYEYFEAKRVLKILMPELKKYSILEKELDMNFHDSGRGAISSGLSVWDCIAVNDDKRNNYTDLLHFVISIRQKSFDVCFTLPDKLKGSYRSKLRKAGYELFKEEIQKLIETCESNLYGIQGYSLNCDVVQRRHATRKSEAVEDSKLSFDLRTAFVYPEGKYQPNIHNKEYWLQAAYESIVNKGSANIQTSFKVSFDYDKCTQLNSPKAVELIIKSWLSFKDFYKWLQIHK